LTVEAGRDVLIGGKEGRGECGSNLENHTLFFRGLGRMALIKGGVTALVQREKATAASIVYATPTSLKASLSDRGYASKTLLLFPEKKTSYHNIAV